MDQKPKHIQLVIDQENRTSRIERLDDRVVELDPGQIVSMNLRVALNGGFGVDVLYRDGKSDMLVFQNKKELLTALANILRD